MPTSLSISSCIFTCVDLQMQIAPNLSFYAEIKSHPPKHDSRSMLEDTRSLQVVESCDDKWCVKFRRIGFQDSRSSLIK